MKIVAVIPARWSSTRLKGKVLADINGKPMVQHVWEKVKKAHQIDEVVVAVDKEPAPIRNTFGLRQFGVVRVIPWDPAMRGVQHCLGFFREAPTVFCIYRENGNGSEQATGWKTVNGHLAAESTREKRVELGVLSRGHITKNCENYHISSNSDSYDSIKLVDSSILLEYVNP